MDPIIVGIDPGTTVGYAIISIEGRVLLTGSRRGMNLDGLITEIYSFGRPILVGTDKKKVPFLIEKFSASSGVKVISPKQDMSLLEKAEFSSLTANSHERDALGAAMLAFRSTRKTLRKIRQVVADRGLEEDLASISKAVIREELPLHHFLQSEDEEKNQITRTRNEETVPSTLYAELKAKVYTLENERLNLLEQINKLKKNVRKSPTPVKQLNERKDIDFRSLWKKNHLLRKKNDELMDALKFVLNWNGLKVRLIETINKRNVHEFIESEILAIVNPMGCSLQSVSKLKSLRCVIVPKITTVFSGISQVQMDSVSKRKVGNYILIDENSLKEELSKPSLKEIVTSYQNERRSIIDQ